MSQGLAAWLVVIGALVLANLPFVNDRLLVVGPIRSNKPFAWRALELVLFWGLLLGLGVLLESSLGQRAPQEWEFFAASGCLFLTLAAPGFVWRHLRKASGG